MSYKSNSNVDRLNILCLRLIFSMDQGGVGAVKVAVTLALLPPMVKVVVGEVVLPRVPLSVDHDIESPSWPDVGVATIVTLRPSAIITSPL